MKVPIMVRVDFKPGTGNGQLMAYLCVTLQDGTELDSFDPVEAKAGQTMSYGPIDLEVDTGAQFVAAPSEAYSDSAKKTPEPPAQVKAAPPQSGARR